MEVSLFEPPREKTNSLHGAKTKAQISFTVTAKLISVFVFATRIAQFLSFLNPKFPVSSQLLCMHRPVSVGPVPKPCWFSHKAAHIFKLMKQQSYFMLLVLFYPFSSVFEKYLFYIIRDIHVSKLP